MRHFGSEEQAHAVSRTQAEMWRGVVARFEHLKAAEGLRQADLAAALGVSRPQVHEWLSDPRNMTLKAAGRLLLAMDAEAHVEVLTGPRGADALTANGTDRADKTPWRLTALAAFFVLFSLLAPSNHGRAEAGVPAIKLGRLDGKATPSFLGQPTILVFWRADCAPCLIELGHLRQLEAASGRARLALVALDDALTAQAKLKAMGLAPRHAWRLRNDPAATLSALGHGAPRLPLSAAYDSAGRPCGLRIGLLGVDQVRNWARACS